MSTDKPTVPTNGNGGLWQKLGIGLIALLLVKESYGLVDHMMQEKSKVDVPSLFKQQELILNGLSQAIRDQNEINKDTTGVLRQISGSIIIMQEKQLRHFEESSEYFKAQKKYTTP